MSGGGGTPERQTQIVEPWAGVSPFLTSGYRQGFALPRRQFYPGDTLASPASLHNFYRRLENSQDFTRKNRELSEAEPYLEDVLRGDYLYGGEGFNAALEAAENQILPTVRGQFAEAGRYGSGLAQEAETRALGDAFASLYGQERGYQQQAASLAPALRQVDLARATARNAIAREAATGRIQLEQAEIDAKRERFDFNQAEPYERLLRFMGLLSGAPSGGTTTATADYGSSVGSRLGGAVGGGLLGYAGGSALAGTAALAPAFAAAPWLLPIFAGAGALGGGLL